jgi:hypothetical protein
MFFHLDPPPSPKVCGIKTFAVLNGGLNATGLAGLDRLLGFRIVHELGFFLQFYREHVKAYLPALQQVGKGGRGVLTHSPFITSPFDPVSVSPVPKF